MNIRIFVAEKKTIKYFTSNPSYTHTLTHSHTAQLVTHLSLIPAACGGAWRHANINGGVA